MSDFILYGAGGHARVIIDCISDSGHTIKGFFDDDDSLVSLNGFDVLGTYDSSEENEAKLIVTIGDNMIRKKVVNEIDHDFGIAQHPSCIVSKYTNIGKGTVLIQGSIVQSGTSIGLHCIINTGCSIDHDCRVGDYVHISPRVTLCANVEVGEGSHIGAGATILPGVKIGSWCQVGAGAVITKDVPDQCVVVGVPGKVVRRIDL